MMVLVVLVLVLVLVLVVLVVVSVMVVSVVWKGRGTILGVVRVEVRVVGKGVEQEERVVMGKAAWRAWKEGGGGGV